MNAEALAERVEAGKLSLEDALLIQLKRNQPSPVTQRYLPMAYMAVVLASEGKLEYRIKLALGGQFITVGQIIEKYGLGPFVSGPEELPSSMLGEITEVSSLSLVEYS